MGPVREAKGCLWSDRLISDSGFCQKARRRGDYTHGWVLCNKFFLILNDYDELCNETGRFKKDFMRFRGGLDSLWLGDLVADHRSVRRLACKRLGIPANQEPDVADNPIAAFDASDLNHLLSEHSLGSF